MKLLIYWLTTELENGNGTETNLFPSQEALEKAMAAHITARIEEIREGNEPAAEQALADEVEALLAGGDSDRAWELYKDGEAGDGIDMPAELILPSGERRAVTPANGTGFTLEEAQAFVGGYVEAISLEDGRLMLINEEGKFEGLERNDAATVLALMAGIAPEDCIVGAAVLCDRSMFK